MAAHTLKGSGANMGLMRLSDMASWLEILIDGEKQDETTNLLDEIEEYVHVLFADISGVIGHALPTQKQEVDGDILGRALG